MEQKKKHSFQLKKTEFISDKDDMGMKAISLELLQSSCIMTYALNRNNIIESNNLIYLNGSFVTFYNFFQSNKHFAASVSEHPPVGMAGANVGKNSVVVATQPADKSQIQLAVYTVNEEHVPTHILYEEMEFIDVCFMSRNLVVGGRKDNQDNQYYIYTFKSKSFTATKIAFNIKRIISFESKVVIMGQKGIIEYDEDHQNNFEEPEVLFPDLEILDYVEVEGETKLILTPKSLVCIWSDSNRSFEYQLDPSQNMNRLVKVGRNILLAHRNQLALTHLVIGEECLRFENQYHYNEQKLRAGIVNIQASQDEMHLALGVEVRQKDEIKIQNFIFNMSTLSASQKLINPFTRMMPMGFDSGAFSSMVNVLSSNAYILIGSKISNLNFTNAIEKKRVFNLYEVPKFLAVHPLSYQLACGFDGVLKFYSRVQGQILQIWKENLICTAASYSNTGNLALCVLEDSYYSLILYDCYKFQKTRMIPVSYLKLAATKIDWVDENSALLLTSPSEMMKLNISSGEKVSQFRQRQQVAVFGKIKSIDYDVTNDCVFSGIKQGYILWASKNSPLDIPLSNYKVVNLGQPFEVTFIKIVPLLKVVFFGTACGTLAWCPYPLKIKKSQFDAQQKFESTFDLIEPLSLLKIHNVAVNFIGITPNNRFLIVNIKKQGYFNFKVRWQKTGKDNFTFHDLANPVLNTIDVSSISLFETNKQRLKIALEKRKACFNDLEEFRRQCQVKIAQSLKNADFAEKQKELQFINQKIADIEASKQKKKQITKQIEDLELKLQGGLASEELKYEKKMLSLYNAQDHEQENKRRKVVEYEEQLSALRSQCRTNLGEISENLSENFLKFAEKYRAMAENAQKFKKRAKFQEEEQRQIKTLQIQNRKTELSRTEVELSRITNDLSVKITHCRKQNDRYLNRKGFLEHKIRFFEIENMNCLKEQKKLNELKTELEKDLKRLEVSTLNKEQKLKTNIRMNETLQKFKNVFEYLTKVTTEETMYVKEEKRKTSQRIADLQQELEEVAAENQQFMQLGDAKKQELLNLREEGQTLKIKGVDILYYVKEIALAFEKVKDHPEGEKEKEMKRIYMHFYENKKVQELASQKSLQQANEKTPQEVQTTRNKQKAINSELKDRKKYVVTNFNLLKDYNNRAVEEINLNLLQIQAQNYNLIAECNSRKQQTVKKKKILHQLIDSVKQTQIYLDEMKNSGKQEESEERRLANLARKPVPEKTPFATYEQMRDEKLMEKQTQCESTKIGQSRHLYRKMLDVKRLFSADQKNGRRIMTATQKAMSSVTPFSAKPMTADKRKRQTLKSALTTKEKSTCKPLSFSRMIIRPPVRN